jgi:hypothetical protein
VLTDSLYPNAYSYGFYQLGDRRTFSKIEFIEMLSANPTGWHYNFNDELFSCYDWSVEPSEDINVLYRKRAEQLRKKYDHLVLFYSGGYDSSNILYSFLDNNIKLDEVCTWSSQYDRTTEQHYELETFTYPKLKALKEKFPHVKINHWEYGDHFKDWEKKIKQVGAFGNDMHVLGGALITMNRLIVDFAHEHITEYRDRIAKGERVAFIQGSDKPMLRYKDNKWIFNFHDGIVQGRITNARRWVDDGTIGHTELFYWGDTHECAEIIRKQCHLLKNKYNTQAQIDFSKIPGVKKHKPGYGWEIDNIHLDFVKTIYPRLFSGNTILPNETWCTIKGGRNIFGNRDQWYTLGNHESASKFHSMWKSADVNPVYQPWYNDNKSILSGIRSCLSRDYVI